MPAEGRSLRLLVTGACGYLGSRLIRDLATSPTLGSPLVRVLDNFARGSRRALMELPPEGRFELLEADLLDPSAVRMALKDIDVVVHLAAVVSSPITFDDRPVLAQVNNWGTGQLVDACLAAGVRRMIYVSTTAVYGTGGPFVEGDACEPLGSYAQSKWDGEQAVVAGGTRGLEWTILRLGSLFGLAPVVRFDTVANRFAYLAGVGRTLPIFGSGKQRRPLVHVQDASSAIVHVLSHEDSFTGRRWNIVGANPTIDGVASAIRSVWPETKVRYTDQQVMEHLSLQVSGAAARSLGWTPQITLASGLEELLAQFGPITQVGGHAVGSSEPV